LFIFVTWLVHMCDMTRSYVWHDSFICVTWLIRMCDMTHSYIWHDSIICATWLSHVCDMTQSHVCHDSCICYMWHIHKRQSHSDTFICVSTCVSFTYICVWHDSSMPVTWLTEIHMTHLHTSVCDMTDAHMGDMTDSYVWHGLQRSTPTELATFLSKPPI